MCCYVLYFIRTQKGANDTAQGSYLISEDEDVSISSVSSSCLYKCLRIARWFDGVGEEADEEMFLERSGSCLMSQDWIDAELKDFCPDRIK